MSQENAGLSVSFLDVLSCSLGAMILLFLVFSTLSHQGDRASDARSGIVTEQIQRMVMATELGADEVKAPLLFEIQMRALSGSNGSVTLTDPPADDPMPWATVTKKIGEADSRNSVWRVFIPPTDGGAAVADSRLSINPPGEEFQISVTRLTGLPGVQLPTTIIRSAAAGEASLRFDGASIAPTPGVESR